MNSILIAAIYALIADVVATFFAALFAVIARGHVNNKVVGAFLSGSAGFILGVAFLVLIPEAQSGSKNNFIVVVGIAIGILLMIGLGTLLGEFGMGEHEEEGGQQEGENKEKKSAGDSSDKQHKAKVISYGIAIHNVPEALPIGAAIVISPTLSLLVAVLMMTETFAESGSIAGELMSTKARTQKIFLLTMWPSILSMIGAPIGVILAGISPLLLGLTLGLAAGIMLFIAGEVWTDGRKEAGTAWSSIGLLIGVIVAVFASAVVRGGA